MKFKIILITFLLFSCSSISSSNYKKNSFNSDKIFLFGVENKFVYSAGSQSSARDKVGLGIKNVVNRISKIIKKY